MKTGGVCLLVTIAGLSLPLQAQIQGADAQANITALSNGEGMFRSFDNRSKATEGTPFLFPTFQRGYIVLLNDKKYTCDQINFDAVKQDVVVVKDGYEFIVDQGTLIGLAIFAPHDTVTLRKVYNQDGKWVFVEQLVAGKPALLKTYRKRIKEPTGTAAYSLGNRTPLMETEDQYFLTLDGRTLNEIKNKKNILAAVPNQKDRVEKFWKAQRTSLKKEEDLIRLVQYLNQAR